jgi:RHS repeat-associated protein
MSFDRMGRRVTKNAQRFVYDGYLQIANSELETLNSKLQTFIWDPTEPMVTRPLVWNSSTIQPFNFSTSYYTHDGNKNVSDLTDSTQNATAHYEYAPFGALLSSSGSSALSNSLRFSSEYADDNLGLVYYNYRHYDFNYAQWLCRDLCFCKNLYTYVANGSINNTDLLGCLSNGETIYSITIKKKDVLWWAIIYSDFLKKDIDGDKDTYGHWWIEIGKESYGWWPKQNLSSIIETIIGVEGTLNGVGVFNGTATTDPHHGDKGDIEFNPKVDFGGFVGLWQNRTIKYGAKKDHKCKCLDEKDIIDGVKDFAKNFKGKWSYPIGPNCHTFVSDALEGNCLKEP